MTTSTSLSGAQRAPKPPERGSFPLDHLSECRRFAKAYRQCLQSHDRLTASCRPQARAYLQCRMQRGLMAQDDWHTLGLSRDEVPSPSADAVDGDRDAGAEPSPLTSASANENANDGGGRQMAAAAAGGRREKQGFVAGLQKATLRKQRAARQGETTANGD